MEAKLPEEIGGLIGEKTLREFGIEKESFSWKRYAEINLNSLTLGQVKKLRDAVAPHVAIRGGKILLKDIDTWLSTIEKGHSPKARTVEQFSSILTQVMARVPGHRVYGKNDVHGDAWLAYYVDEITYHAEERSYNGGYRPAYCAMGLIYEEFGGRKGVNKSLFADDCLHKTPEEVLVRAGLYLETPEMRAKYLAEVAVFAKTVPLIGKQYYAVGVATDDLDGNKKNRDSGWWSSRTNRIVLEKDGAPSRVVIDKFVESDKEERERTVHINTYFWKQSGKISKDIIAEQEAAAAEEAKKAAEDQKKHGRVRKDLPDEDVDEEPPTIEIPIHPFAAVFDLKRHLRLRVHINYLTEYIYDPALGSKLILPEETRQFIELLISDTGVYEDIIKNKGGGSVVLCAGPPGTGKTLTAEVYAEVMARPLYSIQCSQLGTDPDHLEDELLKCFSRSQRWNAILLLDEADVYVHRRGDDLTQNSIVGVFLRTLEYYNGVLFLTTNRAQDVDDAIASRCIARIEYLIPPLPDQKRIWRVLADSAGLTLDDATIGAITTKHGDLSGRDIKNLLKLAKKYCTAMETKINSDTIDFVRKFKPTGEVYRGSIK
jgi:hypothetical protein